MDYIFKWRIIEPWCEPDGQNYHSPSKSFLSWKDMKDFTPGSPTVKFVEDCKRWGYNGIAIYMNPEDNIDASSSFAKHLKKNGLGMIIRRDWRERKEKISWPFIEDRVDKPKIINELCPYSTETKQYWEQRAQKDYELIPDLLGYRMSASGYDFSFGAPWMCDCEECIKHSPRERTRDAIRLVSNILSQYGGVLFWETCQDDPNGQYEEAVYFDKLTGEIPQNAHIVLKETYWDYHPGYPRHPLFDTITKDEKGKSPYMTSIQLAGEYRGVHKFVWCMVDDWAKLMPEIIKTGQEGLWVMAIVKYNGWDHPLNMVNWYAVKKFMQNPSAEPTEIKTEWAEAVYGKSSAPTVIKVIELLTQAARYMFDFRGLWTQEHSRFPTLSYLDARLCGPSRKSPLKKGYIGQTWPLNMYIPERRDVIEAQDSTRLIFRKEHITKKLKTEMIQEKEKAIWLVRDAVALWDTLKGSIAEKEYSEVKELIRGNIDDAIIWHMAFDMYMDMKLGKLTEQKIDMVLDECRNKGLRGTIVDDPLDPDPKATDCCHEPSSLKTFAEELRREIRNPWLEAEAMKSDGEDKFSVRGAYDFIPKEL